MAFIVNMVCRPSRLNAIGDCIEAAPACLAKGRNVVKLRWLAGGLT
jgi:hypothetical protein